MLYSVLGSMWRCRNEGLGEVSNLIPEVMNSGIRMVPKLIQNFCEL